MRVLSLNTCLLPTATRWIFRGNESLSSAKRKIYSAIAAEDDRREIDVLHLQEIWQTPTYSYLRDHLRSRFPFDTGFTSFGVTTFSKKPLQLIHSAEYPNPNPLLRACLAPKGWVATSIDSNVHVNVHLACEIDGASRARVSQAEDVREFAMSSNSLCFVVGDTNEGRQHIDHFHDALLGVSKSRSSQAFDNEQQETYSWLWVKERFDRAYIFHAQKKYCSEIKTEVLQQDFWPDVSDHQPVAFTFSEAELENP